METFIDLDKPYHTEYHGNIPLNTNGPYQYSLLQIEKQKEKAKIIEENKIISLGILSKNSIKSYTVNPPILEQIDEKIKIKSISKKEFIKLQHQDIIEELKEIINN